MLTARVARLDADGTYWGLGDAVALDTLKAGDFVFGEPALAKAVPDGVVHVERDCDLPGGRYRLAPPDTSSACWHFVPLETPHIKPAPSAPTLEQALRDLVRNGAQGAVVQAWVKSFEEVMQ